MAKVTPTEAPTPMRKMLRGRVLFRLVNGQLIASKWPRPKGPSRTPYDQFHRAEFGFAAVLASRPVGEQLISAEMVSVGSQNVPRDFLTAAAMGTAMAITLSDGTKLRPYRMVQPNPQLMLDEITDEVGAILYRADIGWVGLPPGNAGQVLSILNGLPLWQNIGNVPGGAGWEICGQWTHSSNVASVNIPVAAYNEYLVQLRNVPASSSGFRVIRLGTGSGPTYFSDATDYKQIQANGTELDASSLMTHTTTTTSARSVYAHILAAQVSGVRHTAWGIGGILGQLNANTDPITGIQIATTAGNMTGGEAIILGR